MTIAFEFTIEMLGKTHRHETAEYFWGKDRIDNELRLVGSVLAIVVAFHSHNELTGKSCIARYFCQ